MALVHEPLGKPGGPGLFGMKGAQLPAFIQHIRNDIMEEHAGMDESHATAIAVSQAKKLALKGNREAIAAVAEWERLKARAHADNVGKSSRAVMSAADVNNLPDSDFAYIEPGGSKDGSGRTVPRSLRHFPVHDAAHIRNALARLPQSNLSAEQKAAALKKIRAAAKKAGVEVGGGDSGSAQRMDAVYFRTYDLEDIHVVRSGQGGDGRTVEAYAAVFNTAAEIRDHEGHYVEEIDPAAFNKTLADVSRSRGGFGSVKCMYNHGMTVHGTPSERGSVPIGVPVDIRPETRGLLTRTRYLDTPFADEILENVRAGAITAQSFTGRIVRSDPQLRRGETYRPRNGSLQTVRRHELGLREYGPTPFPAYSGAEVVGVRMSLPGAFADDVDDPGLVDEVEGLDDGTSLGGEAARGEPLVTDEHSARYHQHALYALRSRELRESKGLTW